MKYLKTFEESTDSPKLFDFNKKWNDKFIKWFKENGLEKVELPEPDSMDGIHQYMKHDEFYDVIDINYEKNRFPEIWITAEWTYKEKKGKDSWRIGFWDEDVLKEIWNYLQNLTPEQIEDIRANQEAEKFNF